MPTQIMALLPAGRALSLVLTPAGLFCDPATSNTLNPAARAAEYEPFRLTVKCARAEDAVTAGTAAAGVLGATTGLLDVVDEAVGFATGLATARRVFLPVQVLVGV